MITVLRRCVLLGAYMMMCGALLGGCIDETESVDTSVCLSGTRWTGGSQGSSNMHPGRDCISCHASEGEGPRFSTAGTLFGRAGEADDCFGAKSATIQLTDSAGKVITMASNDAGNFYSSEGFTPPYTAKVIFNGEERVMASPQTNGACNSCHTSAGANGAPGRILLPGVL